MPKLCDNKSAGMVIEYRKNFAVIKRKNYPEAYALPAGHLDGDDFKKAAIREALEETSVIVAKATLLLSGGIENPCQRDRSSCLHDWDVYYADEWSGNLVAGDDAAEVFWKSVDELRELAKRTEYFMNKYQMEWQEVRSLTRTIFGDPDNPNTDPEWKEAMGLEPVWYYILRRSKLGIL